MSFEKWKSDATKWHVTVSRKERVLIIVRERIRRGILGMKGKRHG